MAEAGNGNYIPPILNSSCNWAKVKSPTKVWREGMIGGVVKAEMKGSLGNKRED